MKPETTIVIADDHPFLRRGLRMTIETDAGFSIVGEAENGEAALALITEHEPDLAILDIDMPIMDGFAVAAAVRDKHLAADVIFLTMHDSEPLLNKALELGAKGFVLKDSAMPEIVDCIRTVVAGRNYISPRLTTYLINRAERSDTLAREKPTLKDLTPSERHVLKRIAEEKTSREIADELFISIRTVDRHRANVCAKLGLHGTNALLKFAVAHRTELS